MELPIKLAFLDIETTGPRLSRDRIIEIAVLRVENNQLVKSYQTLLNPDCYLPPEITLLTGITQQQLEKAPSFHSIKDHLLAILDECFLVAHNVRFDYGFLKYEFKRFGQSFNSKHFCTVKLSRKLFPRFKHHNLDSIIQRHSIECKSRHRAFDDAGAIWQFYKYILSSFPQKKLEKVFSILLKKPSLPINLSPDQIKYLPETPGVYIFYGDNDLPLYIGKSINVKERVISHFSNDHSSPIDAKISLQIKNIETITSAGELGALLLESALIKKHQPLYNKKLRGLRKLIILKEILDSSGYLTVELKSIDSISLEDIDKIRAIFRSVKQAKEFLIGLAKENKLCGKLLSIDYSKGSCFGYKIESCKGACIKKEKPASYNGRFILAFSKYKLRSWPFPGPILIEEENALEDLKEGFIVDKWCLIAKVESKDANEMKLKNYDYTFDLDTYKIIERYLKNRKSVKNIQQL